MGNDYTTVGACGFKGRVCDLSSYPDCDRHSMVGVSPLPGDQPQDPNAQKQWVDGWVGTVHSFAGICKLPAGKWGIYYERRGSAPLIPITSEPTPEPTPELTPELTPEPTPEPVPAPEVASTPEATPDAGVAQATGLDMPISVGSPDPEESSSFSIMEYIRPIQEFGEGLIPASKQKEYGIYGAVGVGAVAFLVGAFALVRSVAKRVRSKPKVAGLAPPVVELTDIEPEPTNREVAAKVQLMLAVHEKINGMEWYRMLTPDFRLMAMRSFAEGGGMFAGYRSTGDSPAGGVIAQVMAEGGESVTVLQDVGGEQVRIKLSELANAELVWSLEQEYRGIVKQIIKLKGLEHSSAELIRIVDEDVLARALLLEKHVMQMEGSWDQVKRSFDPGGSELAGPVSPDWIKKRAAETRWGVDGRGDPLGPVLDHDSRLTPVPGAPIDLSVDMQMTKVGEFSPFFAQLLTVEGYGELDRDTQKIILAEQELFQEAIDIAREDEGFCKRFIDAGKIKPAGLVMVLNEVLSKRGIDIMGRGFSDKGLRREIKRGRNDKWVGRLRERITKDVHRHVK